MKYSVQLKISKWKGTNDYDYDCTLSFVRFLHFEQYESEANRIEKIQEVKKTLIKHNILDVRGIERITDVRLYTYQIGSLFGFIEQLIYVKICNYPSLVIPPFTQSYYSFYLPGYSSAMDNREVLIPRHLLKPIIHILTSIFTYDGLNKFKFDVRSNPLTLPTSNSFYLYI